MTNLYSFNIRKAAKAIYTSFADWKGKQYDYLNRFTHSTYWSNIYWLQCVNHYKYNKWTKEESLLCSNGATLVLDSKENKQNKL